MHQSIAAVLFGMRHNFQNLPGIIRFASGLSLLWWSFGMRVAVNRMLFRPGERFMRSPEPKNILNRSILDNTADQNLSKIYVTSNSSMVSNKHPTVRLVLQRLKRQSKPGSRHLLDRDKVALSIEGGGMRGCVAAGAAASLDFLGLNDAVDCVYGSSAGSMIGAYFIARQVNGVQVYHDLLPSAGRRFIDKSRLLNAAGVPTSALSPRKLRAFLANNTIHRLLKTEPASREDYVAIASRSSVINLHFLLDKVMGEMQSLDWQTFAANERLQPLHVVTTNVDDLSARILTRQKGNFHDLFSLLDCIRASMLVPGVTEPLMTLATNNSSPKASSLPTMYGKHRIEAIITPNNEQYKKAVVNEFVKEQQLNNQSLIVAPQQLAESMKEHIAMKSWILLQQWVLEQLEKRNSSNVVLSSSSSQVFRTAVKGSNSDNNRFWEFRQRSGQVFDHIKLSVGRRHADSSKPQSNQLHQQQNNKSHSNDDVSHKPVSKILETTTKIALIPLKRDHDRLCDAFLAEPIPYRSAIADGATHVIVLRTRPDPSKVLGKGPGIYEQLIARRYFQQYQAHEAIDWLMNLQHVRIYAEDILTLNEAAHGPEHGINFGDRSAHILPIAVIDSAAKEVGQLETKREKILEGMRDGARRVLEIFLPEILALEEQGMPSKIHGIVTEQGLNMTVDSVLDMIFPLSILERPVSMQEMLESISLSKGNLI